MLPSEIMILMAIATNNNGKTLLERPMDITSEYIGYLYNSLVSRSFLERYRVNNYRLTNTGKKIINDFLDKNSGRAEDIIKKMQLLGIDINPEIEQVTGELEGEPVRVMK